MRHRQKSTDWATKKFDTFNPSVLGDKGAPDLPLIRFAIRVVLNAIVCATRAASPR